MKIILVSRKESNGAEMGVGFIKLYERILSGSKQPTYWLLFSYQFEGEASDA